MKAVILADKYSNETIKKIVDKYSLQGIHEFILCFSGEKERIEELDFNENSFIIVQLKQPIKSAVSY